jgi:hypothetical protein
VNIGPVIARIEDQVRAFRLVGGAARAERAMDGITTLPAAFVLSSTESATENPFMDQTVEQQINAEFVVLFAAQNLSDGDGLAASTDMESLRLAARDALLGWVPSDGYHGCEYRSGELLAFTNGVLWWQDTYATAYTIRSA